MVIDIDKALEHSFVLTDQPWQYGLFYKRMQAAGFKTMPLEYPVLAPSCLVPHSDVLGINRNISIAHNHIVTTANALGWDYVTIFRWDAYPVTDCYEKLVRFFGENSAPESLVCLSLGGSSGTADVGRYAHARSERYPVTSEMQGAYAVVYPKSGYVRWLEGYYAIPATEKRFADMYMSIHPECYITDFNYFIAVRDAPQAVYDPTTRFADFSGLDPDTGAASDYVAAVSAYNESTQGVTR